MNKKKERTKRKKNLARHRREVKRRHNKELKEEELLERKKKVYEGLSEPYENPNKSLPRRNELCFCGSGKKFKKCHLEQYSR